MKHFLNISVLLFPLLFCTSCAQIKNVQTEKKSEDMMVRISEIQIDAEYLDEYISILKEEASASVKLEPGVISIYPMFENDKPTEVRILEIYADKKAYEAHLQTPHFKHYKTETLKMVKSLKLIDMTAIDKETMKKIFEKL